MINLIPPAAKRAMKREYWFRVGVVWMLLLSIVLIVTMVLLGPSFVLVQTQLSAYQSELESATEAVAEQQALTASVRAANQRAEQVYQVGMVTPLNRYIERVQALQSADVTIRQISLEREATTVSSVTIVGTAATRNSLTAFSTALNNDALFSDADIPLSNLAANENIAFTLTVAVTNPE